MKGRICSLVLALALGLAGTASAVQYGYYKQAFKISRLKDNGTWTCYSHSICVLTDGAALPYHMKAAFRLPAGWTALPPKPTNLDGTPWTSNGALVQFQPAPCGPGCEIDLLHPAPAGQKWVQFISNQLVGGVGSGQAEFIMDYEFIPPNGTGLGGVQVATWISNDGDDLYGWSVTDQFAESFLPVVDFPAASGPGLAIAAVSLAALAAAALRRKIAT